MSSFYTKLLIKNKIKKGLINEYLLRSSKGDPVIKKK